MATDKDTTDTSPSRDAPHGLMDLDAAAQESTNAIRAMATAAKNMLALDAHALVMVSTLLDQIKWRADELMNNVNSLAEQHGVNWVAESEVNTRLWAQHHALRSSSQASA